MNIAFFGGTFDPVHTGQLRAARAALVRFQLDRVLFVPSGTPPHKQSAGLTPYPHRFAMVALATRGEPAFVPSLLEAPRPDGRPNYSVETVETVRRALRAKDRFYFILGLDSFLDLPNWKDYRRLCELVEFIVVSRPGFGNRGTLAPPGGRGRSGAPRTWADALGVRRAEVHLLSGVHVPVASRDIRRAARAAQPLAGLVPPLVEEYIVKEELYRPGRPGRVLK